MFGMKKKKVEVMAYAQGAVIPLTEVEDEVFSSGMMGEGFAIKPTDPLVVAPFDGKIVSIFPTKHAISLRNANGVEVLLHFGLDTVELDGKPFEILIDQGSSVTAGDPLAKIDLTAITEAGKQTDLIFVIPDKNQYKELTVQFGGCQLAETVAVIK